MEINQVTTYTANVIIIDPITGEESIVSLQATKSVEGALQGFICGIPYEDLIGKLNTRVEVAYQNFIAQIPTN